MGTQIGRRVSRWRGESARRCERNAKHHHGVERWRRRCLLANRVTLPQKWPPPPRNVAHSCELTEMTKPTEPSETPTHPHQVIPSSELDLDLNPTSGNLLGTGVYSEVYKTTRSVAGLDPYGTYKTEKDLDSSLNIEGVPCSLRESLRDRRVLGGLQDHAHRRRSPPRERKSERERERARAREIERARARERDPSRITCTGPSQFSKGQVTPPPFTRELFQSLHVWRLSEFEVSTERFLAIKFNTQHVLC